MRALLTMLLLFAFILLAQPGHTAALAVSALPTVDALGDTLPEAAIARLGTSRFRLDMNAGSNMALSPAGKRIATFKRQIGRMSLVLIDAATGREERTIPAERISQGQLEFTAEGKELVAFSYDGQASFFDVAQGKVARQLKLEGRGGEAHVVSADGSIVVSPGRGSGEKTAITVFDTQANKQLASLDSMHTGQRYVALRCRAMANCSRGTARLTSATGGTAASRR